MTALISTQALNDALGQTSLRIIDASWHMPAQMRDAQAEFEAAHVPGAVFFDIDAASDHASPYPHMLPSKDAFADYVSALGITNEDDVVIYDAAGIFSSARVWWMFRVFGHDKVRVLDGGLLKWKAEGRALETGTARPHKASFRRGFRPELLRTRQQVAENIRYPGELIIDARSPGRFSAAEPEPRPNLKGGHIEGSVNLFFKDVLSPPYHTLKTPEALRKAFSDKGLEPRQKITASCGSGVTACILALALYELGNHEVAVYDGAWAEWASQ